LIEDAGRKTKRYRYALLAAVQYRWTHLGKVDLLQTP
jgi:hypothetical protein